MDVLISWSKPISHAVAKCLYDWLPKVLPGIKPWISSEDIAKGTKWFDELQGFLKQAKLCVVVLTKENVRSPWLYYETGAISVQLSKDVRICPYLVGINPSLLKDGPLGHYMATASTKDDTVRLLLSLNKVLSSPHHDDLLRAQFETHWPEIEKQIVAAADGDQETRGDLIETDTEQLLGYRLSSEARTLLLEGSQDNSGAIKSYKTMGSGLHLETNGRDYTSGKDPRTQATWKEALDNLHSYGLVEPVGSKGENFKLTGTGYKVADVLRGNF